MVRLIDNSNGSSYMNYIYEIYNIYNYKEDKKLLLWSAAKFRPVILFLCRLDFLSSLPMTFLSYMETSYMGVPLSSEGSLACHTDWSFGTRIITNHFNVLIKTVVAFDLNTPPSAYETNALSNSNWCSFVFQICSNTGSQFSFLQSNRKDWYF